MIGHRKRSFANAHQLLQILRRNPDNLGKLKELQDLLLSEIIRAEEAIRSLKVELKNFGEAVETGKKKKANYLENRIEGFRHCAYIWRCFGDAIAFLYMDKYALKQTFYHTENTNPKQDAGFISGKEGILSELEVLNDALSHNVPALLVDLTNTIRYGDICLVGGGRSLSTGSKSVEEEIESARQEAKKEFGKAQYFFQ